MRDEVWNSPSEGRFANLLDEAEYLGGMAASQYNKMASTGVSSMVEYNRIAYAFERLEEIEDVLGVPGYRAFEEAFDEEIDFSLNTDWRGEVDATPGDDHELPF